MLTYLFYGIFSLTIFFGTFNNLEAASRSYTSRIYSKKRPYAGYGKTSKVNGLPKYKIISGHQKKTSKNYTYVNPYARSK